MFSDKFRKKNTVVARVRKIKICEKMQSKSNAPKTVENASMTPVNVYASRQCFGRALQRSRKFPLMSPRTD